MMQRFSPKNSKSIAYLVELFNTFSVFSILKPNLTKCKIMVIGALNEVQLAVCGMKRTDVFNKAIKILDTYFSYNSTIKEESNFLKIVSNVETVLKLWRFLNLTLEGRTVIFKSLAISKIVFEVLIAAVRSHIIKALKTIQSSFLWNNTKIRPKTIWKNVREGGLKNVDIRNKLTSLQIS